MKNKKTRAEMIEALNKKKDKIKNNKLYRFFHKHELKSIDEALEALNHIERKSKKKEITTNINLD